MEGGWRSLCVCAQRAAPSQSIQMFTPGTVASQSIQMFTPGTPWFPSSGTQVSIWFSAWVVRDDLWRKPMPGSVFPGPAAGGGGIRTVRRFQDLSWQRRVRRGPASTRWLHLLAQTVCEWHSRPERMQTFLLIRFVFLWAMFPRSNVQVAGPAAGECTQATRQNTRQNRHGWIINSTTTLS